MLKDAEKELLARSEGKVDAPIPYDKISKWIGSDNIEVLGIVYVLVTDERFYPKIDPPLSFEDFYEFILNYFERCIVENPDGEWSDSRYTAGWDLVNLFKNWWDDKSISRKKIDATKKWIANVYKQGDDEIRNCVITAILEHLFENKKIAKYFSNWKSDSILKEAYDVAIGFSKELRSSQ